METNRIKKIVKDENLKSLQKRKYKPLPLRNVLDSPNNSNMVTEATFARTIGGIIRHALQNGGLSNYHFKKEDIKNIRIEAAKLMSQGVTDFLGMDNILQIFSLFENGIKSGKNVVINFEDNGEELSNSDKDKIIVAIEASLTSLYISSSNMDSRIYLEDLLEEMISFITYIIKNWIYPTFKYERKKNFPKGFFIFLSHNISEILVLLSEVLKLKKFTDNVILEATSLGISSLFTIVCSLQLSSVKLLVAIFSLYDQHRKLIYEDLFLFLKDHNSLHPYTLNSGEEISLFTALSLLLIQCTVSCPVNVNDRNTTNFQPETLILERYKSANLVAYDFLYDFINRAMSDGKVYRSLLNTFLQDLLLLLNKPEWPTAEFVLTVLGELSMFYLTKTTDLSLRLSSIEFLSTISAKIMKDMIGRNSQALDQILNINVIDSQSDDLTNENNLFFVQQTLSKYLMVESKHNSLCLEARMFNLAVWYKKCHVKLNQIQSKLIHESRDDLFKLLTNIKHHFKNEILNFTSDDSTITSKSFDNESMEEVVKYLNCKGSTLYSNFKIYFDFIIKASNDLTMKMRQKSLKGISTIIEIDPSILSMGNVQLVVRNSFFDCCPVIRESAIDTIGKFINLKPESIPHYYIPLLSRILDISIAVRKKVIKILMDICYKHLDLPQLSELLFKIASRINDEESIQNMIKNFFQNFWFTPVKEKVSKVENDTLEKKVLIMINCIEFAGEANIRCFEKLFLHIFKGGSDLNKSSTKYLEGLTTSCQQIVNCLMETLIRLENAGSDSKKLLSCMILINLVSKYKPEVFIPHITNIQPYLCITCSTKEDNKIVSYAALTLGEIVSQIKHPNMLFFAQLEEDFTKLIWKQEQTIVVSSIKCLGQLLNKTGNYKLVYDCFMLSYNYIIDIKKNYNQMNSLQLSQIKPSLNRSIFVTGLLLQQFDFNDPKISEIKPGDGFPFDLAESLIYFFNNDIDTQLCVLTSVGFVCTRYSDLFLRDNVKSLFILNLSVGNVNIQNKVQVIRNLKYFLMEEDTKFSKQNETYPTITTPKKIKEFAEIYLGMASTIIQNYLQHVLECVFDSNLIVRKEAVEIIRLILMQGLMDPCQIVSYLICLCTDEDAAIRGLSEKLLCEVGEKYPGYSHINAQKGMKLSFTFQKGIVKNNIIRGCRLTAPRAYPTAINSLLYLTLKTKQQKRSFLLSLIKQFDEHSKIDLEEMLYIADNLVYFPYKVLDEPLYLIHQIDVILSVSGTNLLQMFDEYLSPKDKVNDDDNKNDDEEIVDEDSIIARLPNDTTLLWYCIKSARGCLLLGMVKQHIKTIYNINLWKMNEYSPLSANKTNNKNVTCKVQPCFTPTSIIEKLSTKEHILDNMLLVKEYLEIKKLINNLDFEGIRTNEIGGKVLGSPTLGNDNYIIPRMDQLPKDYTSYESPENITKGSTINDTPADIMDLAPASKIINLSDKTQDKIGHKRLSLVTPSPKKIKLSKETSDTVADERIIHNTRSSKKINLSNKTRNKRISQNTPSENPSPNLPETPRKSGINNNGSEKKVVRLDFDECD